MELKIGSNSFRNTNGVLAVQRKEQVVFEIRADGKQLLLTMDLYDAETNHVAHLRRNEWAFNLNNRFAVTTGPLLLSLFTDLAWLKLKDNETGEIVLEASVDDKEKARVLSGRFYSHKGQLVEITSNFCRVAGSTTMFGEVFDVRGGAVEIG